MRLFLARVAMRPMPIPSRMAASSVGIAHTVLLRKAKPLEGGKCWEVKPTVDVSTRC
jgi:hypothetical protein